MTMYARALYSYTARNEKELSFKKGDVLAVVEKSGDGNWWDGVFEDKRGYIPVSYVEIAPIPPQRKSSIKPPDNLDKTATPAQHLEYMPEDSVPRPIKSDSSISSTEGSLSASVDASGVESDKLPDKQVQKKVDIPIHSGAVSKLTQHFQLTSEKPQPPPPTQPPPPRVLVPAHKRNQSADISGRPEVPPNLHSRTGSVGKEIEQLLPRSSSDGSRVPKAVSVPTPPRTKPKPVIAFDSAPTVVAPFQLLSHDSGAAASPLQKAVLQQQVHASRKKAGSKQKGGSFKLTGKTKPPIPSKPAAPPKPASAVQLQAELQAVADQRRKKFDGDGSQ